MILKCYYGGEEGDTPATALEKSWCGDCRDLNETLKKMDKKLTSRIQLQAVGARDTWKASDCVFRTNPFNLQEVPTLILYDDALNEIERLSWTELLEAPGKLEKILNRVDQLQ